jgi:hypothetical protein
MYHLGSLKNDLDQIELSLELFEQVGDAESVRTTIDKYKNILRIQLTQALEHPDLKRTQQILGRLKKLHQRLEHDELALKVETAIEQIRAKSSTSLLLDLPELFQDLDFEQLTQSV